MFEEEHTADGLGRLTDEGSETMDLATSCLKRTLAWCPKSSDVAGRHFGVGH